MRAPQIVSVNVGQPRAAGWAAPVGTSAIHKSPVTGPVEVRELGLVGDRVADTKHHGGIYQAVYAFAQEDLDLWSQRLGREVAPGTFGENLTTAGIDVNEAVLGERWRIGSALLQVVEVRIPCNVFKGWMGAAGFDEKGWVKRFTAEARPGPFLRVLEEGTLRAGDPVVVEHRPEHGVTVTTMFRAMTTDRSLLPRLLDVEGLPDKVYAAARKQAAVVRS